LFLLEKDPDAFPSGSHTHSTSFPSAEQKADLSASSHTTAGFNLTEVLTCSGPEKFELTEDIVVTALNDHLLEDFIVSHDRLNILETLGEGEITGHAYQFIIVFNGCVTKTEHYHSQDSLDSYKSTVLFIVVCILSFYICRHACGVLI